MVNQVDPQRDLFIVGEAYSDQQGWIEGALDSCDKVLRKMIQKTKINYFTVRQVAKHHTPDDAWVIYQNKVYDITNWLDKHPGDQLLMLV